jgi:hypothetical protein
MNGSEAADCIRREYLRMPVAFFSIQDDDNAYGAYCRARILSHCAYVRKSNYMLPQLVVLLLANAIADTMHTW